MGRYYRVLLTLVLAIAGLATARAQQQVEFNYNGRVHVGGSPHDGMGYFKFALMSKSPDVTLWANDGAPLDGSEPSSSIATTVTQGFFSVDIGDTSVPNMAALDPSLFNRDDKIYLRSWFSDGAHGFERMQPDRRVVNPALLGTVAFQATDLYVNPSSGNDSNSGLSSSKAKATIQAAWNALPSTLETTATIHLADGEYFDTAVLSGKIVLGHAMIQILGNADSPELVLLNGMGSTTATEPTPQVFLDIQRQTNLIIEGIKVYRDTVQVRDLSIVTVRKSVIERGTIWYDNGSRGVVSELEIYGEDRVDDEQGSGLGLSVLHNSYLVIWSTNIHDFEYGMRIASGATATMYDSVVNNCYFGITSVGNSYLSFGSGGPPSSVTWCHNGILSSENSTIAGRLRLTISNSYDNDQLEWYGGVIVP